MDGNRFDALAAQVATGRLPRRAALPLLGGGILGGLLALLGGEEAAAACRAPGKPCRRRRQCCSKRCSTAGRCLCTKAAQCRQPANPCKRAVCTAKGKCVIRNQANGAPCDGGTCQQGSCVLSTECQPPATQDCGTSNIGACQFGTQTCQSDGTWGPCEGAIGPQPEVCDDLDNDCDGVTDNGVTCLNGGTCQQGVCTCPSGMTECEGVCIDVLTDVQNCGDCGVACTSGTCVVGTCTAVCGDGICDPNFGETCETCEFDCCPSGP